MNRRLIWKGDICRHNTVVVRYRLTNENGRQVRLNIFPLITSRDYHWTTRKNDWPFKVLRDGTSKVAVEPFPGAPLLHIGSDRARCEETGFWHLDIVYEHEAARGLDAVEDLFCPVCLVIEGGKSWSFGTAHEPRKQALKRFASTGNERSVVCKG